MKKPAAILWLWSCAAIYGCSSRDGAGGTTQPPVEPGSIFVTSSPAGAAIALDNAATGKVTPDTLKNVQAGTHTVRLTLTGYADTALGATVSQAQLTTLSVALTALAQWTAQNSGTTATLHAVWGTSASDVFVVGNTGTILHYNGTAWSAMSSGTTENLSGVWGFAANDVYAVGYTLTILHYNGTAWSAMPASNPGFAPLFRAIWGNATTDVWAVGSGYLRMHYNGTAWSGSTNILTDNLFAVTGTSASNVLTVGDYGTAYRFTGSTWSGDLDVTGLTDLWLDFQGVWAASPAAFFVVGDYDPNGTGDGDSSGVVLKFDGTTWTSLWQDHITELRAVWGTSAADLFVAGLKGAIAHYDGSAFQIMTTGTTQNLAGLWGTANDVFAVGVGGTILRYHR